MEKLFIGDNERRTKHSLSQALALLVLMDGMMIMMCGIGAATSAPLPTAQLLAGRQAIETH